MAPNMSAPTLHALVSDGCPTQPSDAALGPVTPDLLDRWYSVPRPHPVQGPGSHDGGERRPWVIVGMITSIDGATSIDGGSGGLGNHTDRMVLNAVRRAGQVVIAGAGTVRNEDYQPDSFPDHRVGVVTASADLDFGSPLFTTGVGFVITSEQATVPSGIEVIRAGIDRVDLAAALGRIREVTGPIARMVVEGGPHLNGTFVTDDLIDEMCITTAPLAVAGPSARLATSGIETSTRFDLEHLLLDSEGYTLARWIRRR